MNDDLVVQKISKLLQNNTSFIGYALNGGIGTKINVRNTETGKTIQALSINVDSSGEVLVVKDSEDNQYKAVTFKTAEKVSEKIVQLRKTKPIDDKKTIEYTDSDIEVFYLFVKLIDTGSPVPTNLTSTWIRKGTSCTEFVGAYERCNYARRETIGGTSYTGLPYTPYTSLNECLNDDTGPDAKTPHGSKDESGGNAGWRYFSTRVSADGETRMRAALESHDANYNTSYKKLFGYGSILECSGAMNLAGWEILINNQTGVSFASCNFNYFPGYTTDCTPEMQAAGYCDRRGFISSKAPLLGQEAPGKPSVGNVDNSWGHQYGWATLPYEFMYKRHFVQQYLNGSTAPGGFYILEVNEDQVPSQLPPNYFPWVPGCPSGGTGGPYDGSGGGRNPADAAPIQKRDMKLSTHKAEIWLGSSKKTEAIKLYELGASDLFSGMYNAFIVRATETQVDIENRLQRGPSFTPSTEDQFIHTKFYENRDKNRIDLNIDPRVWVYVVDNIPKTDNLLGYFDNGFEEPRNVSLHGMISNLYNRTINLTVIDNKTQVVHLKLGLTPRNTLSNTDCKGANSSVPSKDQTRVYCGQSWEYQQYKTITIKDWAVLSTTSTLDTSKLTSEDVWNTDYINRKFFTSFGGFMDGNVLYKDTSDQILLRHDANVQLDKIITDRHFEQLNYTLKYLLPSQNYIGGNLYFSGIEPIVSLTYNERQRFYALSSRSWRELWGKGVYNKKNKRLSSVVGYEKNYYQVVRSYGTGLGLNYDAQFIRSFIMSESYFEYLASRPKAFVSSLVKTLRTDKPSYYRYRVDDRQKTIDDIGTLFYFTESRANWTQLIVPNQLVTAPPLPSSYYIEGYGIGTSTDSNSLQRNLQSQNEFLKIMDTRSWFSNLWAQFVYDEIIKVDVDSYKDVNFTLPINISQYKKFSITDIAKNAEFPLSTAVNYGTDRVELETVLSPGKLEVANKQITITKPTNVSLNPNLSFLVYMLPHVTVTKKKKEI